MFWSDTESAPLRERACDALRLVSAFLTLEDDYDVDWELDLGDEDAAPAAARPRAAADARRSRPRTPHASPRRLERRAGAPPPAEMPCLSPLPDRRRDGSERGPASRPR